MSEAPDLLLADEVSKYFADPLGFTMFAFPWDSDASIQLCKLPEPWRYLYNADYGPDAWACEAFDEIGRRVRENAFDGVHAVPPVRIAIASGHGIGKSTWTAWLAMWLMSTRPNCHITVTANTADQLATKTWAEICKWQKRCITGHWFESSMGKGSMRMFRKGAEESWFARALTSREEASEAFAGQHAADSSSVYLVDEASAISDKIFEVIEGGLTDGESFAILLGNPTRNTGYFRDCFNDSRKWFTRQIDSRTVQITNKAYLADLVTDHGEDSDYCKVRVRGIFPSASSYQFISTEDVDHATHVHLRESQYERAPKILTVDPAWTGDDELVIGMRQGLWFKILRTMDRNDNDVTVANIIAQLEDEHHADAVIIDAGYGTGIVSAGRTMGRTWLLCWFASAPDDPGYLNKRAEIWGSIKRWLKEGGALDPADKVLYRDLIGPETVPRLDGKIALESKEDMRRRRLPSPNRADALALSFAFPVQAKRRDGHIALAARGQTHAEYDPCALMEKQ